MVRDQRIEDFYQFSLQLAQCPSVKLIEHSNSEAIALPPLFSQLLIAPTSRMAAFEYSPLVAPRAVVYSYMVNFCAQQYRAPKHLSPEHAHINLLLEMLNQDYLHPLIREKGGAYGTAARVRSHGTISLSSYMDPNTLPTF